MLEWMHIRTLDGIVHAFRRRQTGGPRWVAACGARLLISEVIISVDETLDCMTCIINEARQ